VTALAIVAVLLGATLQSATGFGFALVAAPLLVAALGAHAAVSSAAVLAVEINLLTLAGERRRRAVLDGEALRLVAWALPGLAAGVVVLSQVSDHVVAVLVALGVLGGLAARLRARRRLAGGGRSAAPPPPWSAPVAGGLAGALSTATALNGPPLVLHLAGGRATPEQVRDTLAAVLLALGALSAGALLVAGSFDLPGVLPALIAAGVAGQLAGRRVFARLRGDRYERVVTALLAVTAVVAAVVAIV
jgi:uncharacterized membrane protein YfcA